MWLNRSGGKLGQLCVQGGQLGGTGVRVQQTAGAEFTDLIVLFGSLGGNEMNRKMPYGYRIQSGMIVTQSQEAAGVKRIFSLYLAGKSRDQIADALNTEGYCYSAESPKWDKNRVRQALENPRYMGAHDYPAIIADETFRMAQAMKEKRTRKRGNHPALCLILQSPIDGVGQSDGVLGGDIARSVCRRRVLRRLPLHL
mgnify:CR=1 FL=1